MPQKDGFQMLTPPISGRVWVHSVVASLMSTGVGISLLVGGHWIAGGILLAAVIIGWAGEIPRLWRRRNDRPGPEDRRQAARR